MKMKKIFNISAIAAAFAMLLGLASCAPEELSTDQFSDDSVTFAAFAPNPVARGGALRITGSNLQKVTEVVIPGVDPITEIEVVAEGRHSEIRVIVPVNGPEVGPVSVVADGKTFTSLVELTYSEPIILESFSPANAMPGDEITIKGDYMNNIKAVQFEGGATVTEFVAQSRYEMKVVVPAAAVTGKIILCDVDENNNPDGLVANLFYSETLLTIGDPTVKSADRGVLKSGAEVTVTGDYLNMIASANFGGVNADFTVAEDAKSLKLALPATAVDGDLALVSYAGKEFKAGAYTTVVPTDLAIAAETRYKAGLNATITGKDLDLVTGAALAGTALEYTLADGKLTFAIPAAAVDGAVTLTLANGKTVDTEAVELVKPTITEVAPLEIYAEEKITVKGEDLDLVAGVTLGGREVAFELKDGALELTTSVTSVSGKVVLSLANGVAVESADAVNVKYHSLVIVTEMPAAQHIGMEVVLKGSNFDLVENIFIGDVKVTQYSLRTPEEVRFLMPWNPVGMYSIRFDLFNGDSETVATQIEVQLELQMWTIWEGSFDNAEWAGNQDLAWGGYDWSTVKPGDILQIHGGPSDPASDWWCVSLRVGDGWGNLNGVPGQYDNPTVIQVELTQEIIDHLIAGSGLVVTGAGYTMTKIELIREISQETTVWEGDKVVSGWANIEDIGTETSFKDAGLEVGMEIRIYVTEVGATWALQAFDGDWSPQFSFGDKGGQLNQDNTTVTDGYISFMVDEAMYTELTDTQGWGSAIILQGDGGFHVTKITIM